MVANTNTTHGFQGEVIVDHQLNPAGTTYKVLYSNKVARSPGGVAHKPGGSVNARGHMGRIGRSGTHLHRLRFGWGSKGRGFKSRRPDFETPDLQGFCRSLGNLRPLGHEPKATVRNHATKSWLAGISPAGVSHGVQMGSIFSASMRGAAASDWQWSRLTGVTRAKLHRLVDELPEESVSAAATLLERAYRQRFQYARIRRSNAFGFSA